MNPLYQSAQFLLSAADPRQLPPDDGLEVAFAGRSNAGKSSALNVICHQNQLARISKTPGRTQLLNVFTLSPEHRFVDLPGYGYARVPEEVRQQWGRLIEAYLTQRQSLRGLIIVMDARHPLTELDFQMLGWCAQAHLAAHILLSKADKLKRAEGEAALAGVRKALAEHGFQASAQLFSALKRWGVEEVQAKLDEWLEVREGA